MNLHNCALTETRKFVEWSGLSGLFYVVDVFFLRVFHPFEILCGSDMDWYNTSMPNSYRAPAPQQSNANFAATNSVIIAPSSDGGMLIQGVTNDQGVRINLNEWPSSRVTINECYNSKIQLFGSCGDLVLVRLVDNEIISFFGPVFLAPYK